MEANQPFEDNHGVPGDQGTAHGEAVPAEEHALLDMEYFVRLCKKIPRPLLREFLVSLDLETEGISWGEKNNPVFRAGLFAWMKLQSVGQRQAAEKTAERIWQLTDEYGREAVESLIDGFDLAENHALKEAKDRAGRALYFYLHRWEKFLRAEESRRISMHWRSERYASHFAGPKGLALNGDVPTVAALKGKVAELYPEVSVTDMASEYFIRREINDSDPDDEDAESGPGEIRRHTYLIGFNEREDSYETVENQEFHTRYYQQASKIAFTYEAGSGDISVFSPDKEIRRDLARAFRASVLQQDGEIEDLPIREFDLSRLITQMPLPVDGEPLMPTRAWVAQLKIKNEKEFSDASKHRVLASHLTIQPDRKDGRSIYAVAQADYGLGDLTPWRIKQAKIGIAMPRTRDRRAHTLTVQITEPNGLNDNGKSEEERELVVRCLKRWDILHEF